MKMNNIVKVISCLALLAVLSACSRTVAVVNGSKIDQKTFDFRLMEKLAESGDQRSLLRKERLKRVVLEDLINERLMIDEARKYGMTVSDSELDTEMTRLESVAGKNEFMRDLKARGISYDFYRKMTRDKMTVDRFKSALVPPDVFSESQMISFYKNSMKPFFKPSQVLVMVIQMASESEARSVMEEMKTKKIEFEDMAERLVQENRARVTGYGWLTPDVFTPEMASVLKNMRVGQYKGPVKGNNDYFLIKLKERQPEAVARYEEAKGEIRSKIFDNVKKAASAMWVSEKRKSAQIEIRIT